ncbi:hypothetical protein BDV27DRAFT_123604 [Aspergillus caelatus]|uniref:Uncharacterized protein n=1 Tax=Aspergillus caelatus TaxID=61420 RepID=A0A5N7ACM1_9EURO|nr:uncharacterized protein BDV27DRAFT_123604 [Aspergillus caelatus]KAE8367621.1 hypothetical protein BDV27DRAFT_123604 [Aspergillus caelatus]
MPLGRYPFAYTLGIPMGRFHFETRLMAGIFRGRGRTFTTLVLLRWICRSGQLGSCR